MMLSFNAGSRYPQYLMYQQTTSQCIPWFPNYAATAVAKATGKGEDSPTRKKKI